MLDREAHPKYRQQAEVRSSGAGIKPGPPHTNARVRAGEGVAMDMDELAEALKEAERG